MWLADIVSVTDPLTLMKNLKSTPGSIPVTHNRYISPANYQQILQLILLKEIKSTRADTCETWERRVRIQKS